VAEIVSGTDTLPPLQRKMERYITNGAQLGWLIDPYRRQVHVYRAGVDAEVMNDPETVSGDPVMPGFVFEVRQRIFALHADAEGA
jgi:Uma2 family endonuclease